MCILVGDSCDDGNPSTLEDVINDDCLCGGEVDLLNEAVQTEWLTLGPNPVALTLSINADRPLNNIRVLDLQGKVWLRKNTTDGNLMLDVSSLVPGTYLLETFYGDVRSFSRFIVQRP